MNEDVAKFILAYRNRSNQIVTLTEEVDTSNAKPASEISDSVMGLSGRRSRSRRLSSLFELVNVVIEVPSSGSRGGTPPPPTLYESPFQDTDQLTELMPKLWNACTTTQDTDLPARVNVTTAPEGVLAALPGINGDQEIVQAILAGRPDPLSTDVPDPIYDTPTWLLTETELAPDTLRTLERFITTRTQVYRVQVVGYFEEGGPSRRLEAIIDTNRGRPRVVYWRDLTELGQGFDVRAAQ